MNINRTQARTLQVTALARDVSRLHGQCVGCKDCRGVCQTLMDALVLPGIILAERRVP